MPDKKEDSSAKINFKQAIIVALITSVTTIVVTLISTSGNSSGKNSNPVDCSKFEEKIEELEVELDLSVSAENFSDISNKFFGMADSAPILKDSLRKIVDLAEDHLADKKHYAYNLFLLKKVLINKPRRNINTRIEDDEISTYTLIQKTLKNIGFYSGPVSGKRIDTYIALKGFQETRNEATENYFEESNFGLLGNKTYIAIMEEYERNN